MSDVQARVAETVCRSLHPTRWEYHASPCEPCTHVAAALAKAGLLAERRVSGLPTWRELCEQAEAERDAARTELAEWRKVAGVSTPDEMRQDNTDIGKALEAAADWKARAEQAEAAERRGAVAALRDLADDIDVTGYGWTHWTAADRFKERIRARADRIEGDDRG